MFDGITRRIVSMWFPRLASDRVLRTRPVDAPFALTITEQNTQRLYCLNAQAEAQGLHRAMSFADAHAFCPDLLSAPARPDQDARFLAALPRWAPHHCPWVGPEGADGLVLAITAASHLWGGGAELLGDRGARAAAAGLSRRLGLGDTGGAAWALAHYHEGIAPPGQGLCALQSLPVAALRLEGAQATGLQRLGLRTIGDLAQSPRGPLARRFGPELMLRLDQALGRTPEAITPEREPPHYATRLTLPEPIGLSADVMAGTGRLLKRLCDTLKADEAGARVLCLTLQRVDRASQQVELRLASAMRDPARILALFERGISTVDAGFGIDQMRLEASVVEPLPAQQIGPKTQPAPDRLNDLITRIGTRIGLENIQRFLPADSHIPERSFLIAPAAYSQPKSGWPKSCWHAPRPRPLRLFPPEPIAGTTPRPAARFRWRRMGFTLARTTGPERIAPEWWLEDDSWRSGVRDYWHVETREGRRLWMFYTPQTPGWFVQGEFA
ncbi:DNA polymerase Y family protein [uncultured Thioclava sp.]|uniref:Y-family DNA polymerase n=1 Tax=uncultured Thioclava sp. TaxID=473858 RepID=UPI0025DEF5F2|nr:DNA polymerase Y family protein [uncultured Thioclava sp.]